MIHKREELLRGTFTTHPIIEIQKKKSFGERDIEKQFGGITYGEENDKQCQSMPVKPSANWVASHTKFPVSASTFLNISAYQTIN